MGAGICLPVQMECKLRQAALSPNIDDDDPFDWRGDMNSADEDGRWHLSLCSVQRLELPTVTRSRTWKCQAFTSEINPRRLRTESGLPPCQGPSNKTASVRYFDGKTRYPGEIALLVTMMTRMRWTRHNDCVRASVARPPTTTTTQQGPNTRVF